MRDFSKYYLDIKKNYNAATAEAVESFYSIYTDRIYEWLGGLWDGEVGGFYYSVSARDNEPYFPDIESTSQAFNFLRSEGIAGEGHDFPVKMKDKAVKFIASCQDPEDGYFYHKGWGKNISTSRRTRDMEKGLGVIRGFGGHPLYPTAYERLEAAAAAGTTESENSTVPEHLRSEAALKKYLDELDLNGLKTKGASYGCGSRIGQQFREIKAAGLGDFCLDYLNSKQYDNGLWEKELSYGAVNGLMKISGAYREMKRELPHVEKAFNAAIDIAILDTKITGLVDVYNPPFIMLNLFKIMTELGQNDIMERCKKRLLEKAPEMLEIAKKKVLLFAEPDGAFSYAIGYPSPTSQGQPVCVPGLHESDVNANSLAQGARTMTFTALGIPNMPLFDAADGERFFEIAGEK
jgi:hypothetical protein